MHTIVLAAVLMGLWWILSGHTSPLLLTLGVISSVLVALIAHRMDVVDHDLHPVHLGWRIVPYWGWLLWEITLSNLAVVRAILNPKKHLHPTVFSVPDEANTEMGKVIYANSITLTPGTVTLRLHQGSLSVHALTRASADGLRAGGMAQRVKRLERSA